MSWEVVDIDGREYLVFSGQVRVPGSVGDGNLLFIAWDAGSVLPGPDDDDPLAPVDIIDRIDELVNDQLERGRRGDLR